MAARVTLVTHYYPAHRGGVERVAGQLAERLAASGTAEFEWHASDCDAAPEAVRGITPVPARSWNGIERLLGFPYPLWSLGALCRLWKACRSADLVHIHDCLYLPNVVAYVAARRVLVTQHIGHVPYRNPLLRVALRIANGILGRWILGGADRVVFESATVQAYFTRFVRFRSPPRLIANGVDTDHFAPAAAPGRHAERPVLLFLGRFVEKKGLSVLHELAQRLPDVQWLFAGWGPLDPSSWRLANVTVVPSPGAAQLAALYQAADLFVLPTRVLEGFGLVTVEALASGTPVVATPVGATPEILTPLDPRLLAADGSAPALSAALATALPLSTDAGFRRRCREYAERRYSWERHVDALEAVLVDR